MPQVISKPVSFNKVLYVFFLAISLLLELPTFLSSVRADDFLRSGEPQFKPAQEQLPNFSALALQVGPSVVNIAVEAEKQEEQKEGEIILGENAPVASMGSGFILHEDGYIATNNHVIEKAGSIIVRLLNDKREYKAKLVGKDAKVDLALLKIEAGRKLPAVYVGDSDKLEVGEWVLAIGNQFQLGQTVTLGIVSAKSRKVPRGGPYDAFIQTDASINPGSSGGPLFNSRGQVVGINTAIFSPGKAQFGGTGFNIGIGFATPINLVRGILAQLRQSGRVTRGWLGVLIQPVNPDVALALGLTSYDGALVGHIMPGSPAEVAGIKIGDVITTFDGKAISENDELPLLVANTPLGSSVELGLFRERKKVTVKVKIEELKDLKPAASPSEMKSDDLGLVLENVSEALAQALNLPASKGVLVAAVKPGSIAFRSGLQRGDIIESVTWLEGGVSQIVDVNRFNEILKPIAKEVPVLLLVRRTDPQMQGGSTTLFITLKK